VTLLAAIYTRLQGILTTGTGIALFILAMLLIPWIKHVSTAPQGAMSAMAG